MSGSEPGRFVGQRYEEKELLPAKSFASARPRARLHVPESSAPTTVFRTGPRYAGNRSMGVILGDPSLGLMSTMARMLNVSAICSSVITSTGVPLNRKVRS